MGQTETQGIERCVGAALGAATGAFLGRGTGAFFGSALGQGFGALIGEPAIAAIAATKGKTLAGCVTRCLGEVLLEREKGYGPRREPIMAGRPASKCLKAAAAEFAADEEDPDRTLLGFWAEGLDAASKAPGAYLAVFDMSREWEQAADEWPAVLAARLWSPARMEDLFVSELIAFLTHLPENPDACGMSWPDLQIKKTQTAKARSVPRERRRILLARKRELIAVAVRRSFAEAVVEDQPALCELAALAALYSRAALGQGFAGAEADVAELRARLGAVEREELGGATESPE